MTAHTDRLDAVRERLREFTAEREWDQFHTPKNLAMAIASEAGELLAELRWVDSAHSDELVRSRPMRERLEHEIADVAISLILFCNRADIDLMAAIDRKIQLNASNYPISSSKGRPERPVEPGER